MTHAIKKTILFIDDDEDDCVITRELFSQFEHGNFELQWAGDYESALGAIQRGGFDACLLDYRLGLLINFGAPVIKDGIERIANKL